MAGPRAVIRGIPADAASHRYVARANSVCAADLVGLPPSLKAPYTRASLAGYAAAAAAPVRRTVVALARLHASKPLALAAKGMVRAYGQLLPLYASVAAATGPGTARSAADQALLITARQGTATALAGAAGLGSCQFR